MKTVWFFTETCQTTEEIIQALSTLIASQLYEDGYLTSESFSLQSLSRHPIGYCGLALGRTSLIEPKQETKDNNHLMNQDGNGRHQSETEDENKD
jgi:hypothetical protein